MPTKNSRRNDGVRKSKGAKASGSEFDEDQNIHTGSEGMSYKSLVSYKGELAPADPRRHPPQEVIGISIASTGTKQSHSA